MRICIYNYSVLNYKGQHFSKVNFLDWLEVHRTKNKEVMVICPITNINDSSQITSYLELPDFTYYDSKSFKTIISVVRIIPNIKWAYFKIWQTNTLIWFSLFYVLGIKTHVVLVGDPSKSFKLRKDIISNNTIRNFIANMVFHIVNFITNNSAVTVCVSAELKRKYCSQRNDVIIATESWIDDSVLNETVRFNIKKSKMSDGKLKILYVGRIVNEKGLRELILAIANLSDREFSITAKFIGVGKDLNSLRQLSRDLNLENVITFMGYVENNSNQLFNYYREADVFILPSFSEGSPLCIIEAFACKTLVIGSKVGGIPELLENNRGILLNEIEAKEISQKIESVYEKFLTDSTCINTVLDNSFQWAYHKTRIKERKKMYGMTFND